MAPRVLSLIPRLTPPPIVRGDNLPVFSRICPASSAAPPPSHELNHDQQTEQPLLYTSELKQPNRPEDAKTSVDTSSIEEICREARSHRAIFIGEQHEQPKVLSAQLQLLYHIIKGVRGGDAATSTTAPNVHVVFEHWSLDDQPLLDKINGTKGANKTANLTRRSGERTSEGFATDHYGPLIRLTRDLGGKVWGGFPPRDWARIVARAGTDQRSDPPSSTPIFADLQQAFHEVQRLDQERFKQTSKKMADAADAIPPLPTEQYDTKVSAVSWAHRTFLKSMFLPIIRPEVPAEAFDASGAQAPATTAKGFAAAQALKDTFFAHTMSTLLQRDEASVVVGVCGLGHCEWSFGAPERLAHPVKPYVIITKPDDSAFWPALPDKDAVKATGSEWERKQADAILLYEWVG